MDIIDHHRTGDRTGPSSDSVHRLLIIQSAYVARQLSEHTMTPVEQGEATTRKRLDDAYYRAFRRYIGD